MNLVKKETVKITKTGQEVTTTHLFTEDGQYKLEMANNAGDYNIFKKGYSRS